MPLEPDIASHYDRGWEHDRLHRGAGRVEFERSRTIISRFCPPPPARILDVGGGTGPYSFWMAEQGWKVHLVDAMASHVARAEGHPDAAKLGSISVGDARALDFPTDWFDGVLMMGPLYHLVHLEERMAALGEAMRVLRPGGVVIAAAISKFASVLDGYFGGHIDDPVFQGIVRQDLADGQHRNPSHHPAYFSTAKFHEPEEFRGEMQAAGFEEVEVLGVEGFSWLLPDLEARLESDGKLLMEFLARVEREPSFLGASAHLLGVAQKPT